MKSDCIVCHSNWFGSPSKESKASYRLPTGPGLLTFFKDLRKQDGEVRFYYIRSVKWGDGPGQKPGLYQFGNGLNLKSRYATLCTCKRKMLQVIHDDWYNSDERPVYIAVLGSNEGRKPQSKSAPLIFLGKVERTFNSFKDIWNYLPENVRNAKDVRRHPLGDLYPPKLVRKFQHVRQKWLDRREFAEGYVHANEAYKWDLRESRPLVFREWRAWPEADVDFSKAPLDEIRLKVRVKFQRMIKMPRPSAYGWVYRLEDLKPIMNVVIGTMAEETINRALRKVGGRGWLKKVYL